MGGNRQRLAVLIGAGASYGAGGHFTQTPPLGKRLYEELTRSFPATWGNLPLPWGKEFEGNFEQGMSFAWESGDQRVSPLLMDLGRYFHRFQLLSSDGGGYTKFIRLLSARNLIRGSTFASLNYETLFEDSCVRSGFTMDDRPMPTSTDALHFLKPHGSYNFVADFGSNTVTGASIAGGETFFDGPMRVATPTETLIRYRSGVPPAMSLFAPGKHSPVAPRPLTVMRQQWETAAGNAGTIITIGVHPNLDDEHIWGPIVGSSRSELWYVGGTSPAGPLEDLKTAIGPRFVHVSSTFLDALPKLGAKLQSQK